MLSYRPNGSRSFQGHGSQAGAWEPANPSFLKQYSEIEWNKIAKFRDLVSHHYEHVDHEIVYDICGTHIPKLGEVVQKMLTVQTKRIGGRLNNQP